MAELSNELREFIKVHIHSVIRLEVLLLLSENREKVWSAEAVDRKLQLTPPCAETHLDEMHSQGLLVLFNGVHEKQYRFQPSSYELETAVSQLFYAYTTQRVAVLTMIFSNPVDKVRLFTETFRMITGENDVPEG